MDDKIVEAAKKDPAVAKIIQTGQAAPVDDAFTQQHIQRWKWSARGRLPSTKLQLLREVDPDGVAAVVPIPRLVSDEPNAGVIAIRTDGQLMLYLDRPYTTVQWEMRGDPEHDGIRFMADSGGSRFISYKTLAAAAKMESIATSNGGVSAAIMGVNAYDKIDLKNVHPGHDARLTLALNAPGSSPVTFLGRDTAGVLLNVNNGAADEPARIIVPWHVLNKNLTYFTLDTYGMHFGPSPIDPTAMTGQDIAICARNNNLGPECEVNPAKPSYEVAVMVTDGVNEFAGQGKTVKLGTATHYYISQDGTEHQASFRPETDAAEQLQNAIDFVKEQARKSPPLERREGRGP